MTEEKQNNLSADSEPQPPSPVSAVRDKRKLPEGVVPRQAQGYVIAGLAVLILLAVMFSKNHAKPVQKETPQPALSVSTDMNQRKIQELEQDLSADQRQGQRQGQQQAAAQRAGTASTPNPVQPGGTAQLAQAPPPVAAQPVTPPRDPVADAEKALAFKARFASNLVSGSDGAARLPAVA